jgi:ABC-2 type transport system ATP-binding protein
MVLSIAGYGRRLMIEAIDLTKIYEDDFLALDGLNLKVEPGEVYCLLGANGAGKTTTINLFLNFIEPTSGRALINGLDTAKDPIEAKKYVSYVSENVMLFGNLTARQNLEFFASLGSSRMLGKEDLYAVLHEVGLQKKAFEQRVRSFSKGMRQKVGIAIAVIENSPAVLLDEPTSGLDPKAGVEFMRILTDLRNRGKAILMSTHDIFRVREIADRVGIMKEGYKVVELTRKELEHQDLEELYLEFISGEAESKAQDRIRG